MEIANNNTTCAISEAQVKFYEIYSWWLGGIGSMCIASSGILLNTIAIYILCNERMRSSFFNRLLVCLAIVDSLFLANAMFYSLAMNLIEFPSSDHLFIFVNFVYPARNILMCSSIYLTVGLACERYTSATNPYLQRTRQNTNTCYRLLLYIIPVFTFAIMYNIPKFLDLNLKEDTSNCSMNSVNETMKSNCSTEFTIVPTEIRNHYDYILWYINISNLVVTGAIPCVLLTYFNYNIYKSLKQRHIRRATMVNRTRCVKDNSRRDGLRQTFVLFAIIALFVVCHSLRVILNVEEIVNHEQKYEQGNQDCPGSVRFWEMIAMPISAVLVQINSGTNFFIYCVYDDIFKDVLKSKVRCNLNTLTTRTTREEIILNEIN